uniref:Uncharacterized protein n=1 Tax=viral metagenome TaxID=1070528 RepID=A0A6C0JTN6_9ZZZZ
MASPNEIKNMDDLHNEQRSELITLVDQQHEARLQTIFEARVQARFEEVKQEGEAWFNSRASARDAAQAEDLARERTANMHLNEQLGALQAEFVQEKEGKNTVINAQLRTLHEQAAKINEQAAKINEQAAKINEQAAKMTEMKAFSDRMLAGNLMHIERHRINEATIRQKNEALARSRRAMAAVDMERTIVQTRVRGRTCGDNGGRCQDGTRCARGTYLNSMGRCRDH